MKRKQTAEEKYIEHRLACIKASIFGGLSGMIDSDYRSGIMNYTDIIYKHVEKHVLSIIKYQKKYEKRKLK